ncbi:MAG: universal stress protein [Chloroflexi bacterium]|nr:universal stress protein [Chloroflexota bacterium]
MSEETNGIILVAVDGSHTARNAATMAIQLAKIQGYGIHALYVVDEALALVAYSDFHRELTFRIESNEDDGPMALLETQGALALEEIKIMAKESGVPVETEMLLGNVEDLILDRAQRALMVAIGRRGNRHADKPEHLGAHFWQVAHRASVPVLAGGDIAPERVQRLLLTFTGNEPSLKAMQRVSVWQRDLDAEVIVVFTGDPSDAQAQEWQEQVMDRVAKKDRSHYHFLRRPERQAEALLAVAKEEDIDFIVVSEHHRPLALLDELLGSPMDRVLQQTRLPVIIVR